tara:strand:+ start:131 stop:1627 length:1497 start_codon:yes stop_codon:yes gene_type:complete
MSSNNNSKMNRNEKRKKATKRKNKKNKRKSSNSGPSGNKRPRIPSDTSEIGETKESEVLIEKFDDGRLNVVVDKKLGDITAKTGSIYIITNIITLLSYIGLTIREVEKRWQEHEYSGKNNPKYHFHYSIAKHGWGNFKCETLAENVPIEELAELEIYYIKEYDTYNNGYNSTVGGEGTIGRIWTEEQRITQSKAMTTTHDYIEGGGSIFYTEAIDKWVVTGSAMSGAKHIGLYFTKEKGIAALKLYNHKKVRMESDIRRRRNGTGSVYYDKSKKKWQAYGPQTSSVAQFIGQYFTKEKAIKALDIFIDTGKRIPSDVTMRRKGTGSVWYEISVRKWMAYGPERSGKKTYIGQYDLEKRAFEALDYYKKTGKCRGSDVTMRKKGTGSVYYNTTKNYWFATGPQTTSGKRPHIGQYLTEKRAIEALDHFNHTGERLKSDVKQFTGSITETITKKGKRFSGRFGGKYTKSSDSRQQVEEDLKKLILEVNNGRKQSKKQMAR